MSTLLSYLHEVCGPTGERSAAHPNDREVLLANLMQHMEDCGEVFEHVAEYCVYLVSTSTPTARALVGAYVGSAGVGACHT